MSHRFSRTFASLVLALAIAFASYSPALAQAPANDDFDFATEITTLPYNDSINTTEATVATNDPNQSCHDWPTPSVWYSFTPTSNMMIEANTFGSDYDTVLSVYTGSPGYLIEVACNDDFGSGQSRIVLNLISGTTYYFLITTYWETSGNLSFLVQELMQPANDDFNSATVIPELPFNATTNTVLATEALDDPDCNGYSYAASVWYSFTPNKHMTMEINAFGSDYDTYISVWTGSRGDLTAIDCGNMSRIRFVATAGTSYYFLIQGGWLEDYYGYNGGNLTFSAQEYTPQEPPVSDFYWDPDPPSASEFVTFCDNSYDPEEFKIETFSWNFDDGTSSTESCTDHQYMADGDYVVEHSVTTQDGRSASTSKVVQVRTHDVAITRMLVPVSAKAGQTREITIYIKNTHYEESTWVFLYRDNTDWLENIGYYHQVVPVRPGNRTTPFSFNYTFTDSDAMAGKVNFYVIVEISDARDAFPENNEATASTKVHR